MRSFSIIIFLTLLILASLTSGSFAQRDVGGSAWMFGVYVSENILLDIAYSFMAGDGAEFKTDLLIGYSGGNLQAGVAGGACFLPNPNSNMPVGFGGGFAWINTFEKTRTRTLFIPRATVQFEMLNTDPSSWYASFDGWLTEEKLVYLIGGSVGYRSYSP
jgi:hypothetical protein